MVNYKTFKEKLMECWEEQNEFGITIDTEGGFISMAYCFSDENIPLISILLFSETTGGIVRGDSVYEEGMDDDFLQGVFKYITTGEEY